MGFDCTLHPFDERDYRDLIVPVLLDRSKIPSAVEHFAERAEHRDVIEEYLERMREGFEEAVESRDGEPFASVVNYWAAALFGHLHPAFYDSGMSFTFWREIELDPKLIGFIRSLGELLRGIKGVPSWLPDSVPMTFVGNYSAGGFIPAERMGMLDAYLRERIAPLRDGLVAAGCAGEQHLALVLEAVRYAAEHRLALLEATEIVVPKEEEASMPMGNVRAFHLKNTDPQFLTQVREALG